MTSILTIIKKEFKRIFSDKRLIVSLFLPGVIIFAMYSLLGNVISGNTDVSNEEIQIYSINMPQNVNEILDVISGDDFTFVVTEFDISTLDDKKEEIRNSVIDFIIIFPSDFNELVANGEAPNITTFFNPLNAKSSTANEQLNLVLISIKEAIIYEEMGIIFTINAGNDPIIVKNENSVTAYVLAMILPMLLLTFMFTGTLAFTPESIAGEKERGSLATLLVTPTKRSHIALGKVFSLTLLGLISAVSSFLGTILSLSSIVQLEEGASTNIYSFNEYRALLLVILATTVLFTCMVSVISAFAKSVKEATTVATPLMILTVVVGMIPSLLSSSNSLIYLIPIYNSSVIITNIFSFEYNMIDILLTVSSNIVFATGLIILLTRMFNSERIMFSK